ncbi:MAG: hypothetical protein M3238_06110, partial [Actinomycetota bacterium]|nr:hypothetical protein [Actinomycetota bacterium]
MRHKMLLLALSCVLVSVVPLPALSATSRRVTVEYRGSAAIRVPYVEVGSFCPLVVPDPSDFDGAEDACLRVESKPTERFVSVELTDALPGKVPGFLVQEGGVPFGDFCGKTRKPVRVPMPGQPLYLFVQHGTCDGQTSLASKGEATFTFTR